MTLLPDPCTWEVAQDKWLAHKVMEGSVGQPKVFLVRNYLDIAEAFAHLNTPLRVRERRGWRFQVIRNSQPRAGVLLN